MNPPPTTDTPRPLLPAELNRSLVALLLELPPDIYADHRAHVEALAAELDAITAQRDELRTAAIDVLDAMTSSGMFTRRRYGISRLADATDRLAQAIAPPAALPDTSPPRATA